MNTSIMNTALMNTPVINYDLRTRAAAEFIGTAFLLAAVVGSGIMGERLAGGNIAVALLANTLSTGAILVVLILALGPLSGAHFNPVVTLSLAVNGDFVWRDVPLYLVSQFAGAFAGVGCAHLMFSLPIFFLSHHARSGLAQMWSEAVATFGLMFVILACSRFRPPATAYAVGAYITSAYWFTASTSFANPAVTLARAASDTFAGVRLLDVPGFFLAQCVGALAATAVAGWLMASSLPPRLVAARRSVD